MLTSTDLYFHMTNHYKKIKSAKASVDTSAPKFFNDCVRNHSDTMHRNRATLGALKPPTPRYRCSSSCSHMPTHSVGIRKHNCLHSSMSSLDYCAEKELYEEYVENNAVAKPCQELRGHSCTNYISNQKTIEKHVSDVSVQCELLTDKCKFIAYPNTYLNKDEACAAPLPPPVPPPKNVDTFEYRIFIMRILEDILLSGRSNDPRVTASIVQSHIRANQNRLLMEKMIELTEELRDKLHGTGIGCRPVQFPKFTTTCAEQNEESSTLQKISDNKPNFNLLSTQVKNGNRVDSNQPIMIAKYGDGVDDCTCQEGSEPLQNSLNTGANDISLETTHQSVNQKANDGVLEENSTKIFIPVPSTTSNVSNGSFTNDNVILRQFVSNVELNGVKDKTNNNTTVLSLYQLSKTEYDLMPHKDEPSS